MSIMEAKKNPKADLQRRYSLHLSIGFMVALASVVTAFEWRSAVDPPIQLGESDVSIPLVDESVLTDIPEPPKPKVVVMPEPIPVPDDQIVEVVKAVFDPEDAGEVEELPILDEPLSDEVAPEFVDYAEVMPDPEGGMSAFMAYLGKNLKYPKNGIRNGIEGKVYVQFIVDEAGRLTELKVIKGIGADFDDESLRVLAKAPAWKPGRQAGRPVKVRMVLPIIFKLH